MLQHITDAILLATINGLAQPFDSHDVIKGVMKSNPQEYVRELYANVNSSDPIRITHSAIGRRLHSIHGIAATNKVDSTNVRGPDTENQEWQKITPVP